MTVAFEDIGMQVAGETYLAGISASFEPGLNLLLGPTTAGKTTLLRLAAGLDRPSAGRVLVDGRDVTGIGASRLPRPASRRPGSPNP